MWSTRLLLTGSIVLSLGAILVIAPGNIHSRDRHWPRKGSLADARQVMLAAIEAHDELVMIGEPALDAPFAEPAYPAGCSWLSETFSAPALPGWTTSYASRKMVGGRLELTSTSGSYLGRIAHTFNPGKFFTLEMNMAKKVNNNWMGFQPFNDEGPVFQIGSYRIDGFGGVLMRDGRAGMLFYDWNSYSWCVAGAKNYGAVTKIGIVYASNRVALRINGKEVYKISGTTSTVPDQDTVWLIVSGSGTKASFDNVCGR
ncbi:MAG: hypothetical protein AB1714_03995 [Acidobacteriota bacterium]